MNRATATPTLSPPMLTMARPWVVIIGGTAITGGKGGYIGTIAGAIIMTILDDFLTIVNIPEAGRQIMQGVIIVLLVLIYSREKHKK